MNEPITADVECPHCGAFNFGIRPYCTACERPLHSMGPSTAPVKREPQVSRPAPSAPRLTSRRAEPSNDVLVLRAAARWRVLLGSLIDVLAWLGVTAALTWVQLASRGVAFESRFRSPLDVGAEWLYANGDAVLNGLIAATVLGFALGVRPGARTLGRIATGIVVVRSSGRPFNVWVILLRMFGLLLSLGTLGLGFLWALFDPDRRAWHDILSGTVAVEVNQPKAQRFATGNASNA